MTIDPFWIGLGAAGLGLIMTFLMPVTAHRVNQTLIAALIVLFFFVAALVWFPFPESVFIGLAASAVALLFRAVWRWVRRTIWDITKFRRRDYWYRKVGQAVVGRSRRRRNN